MCPSIAYRKQEDDSSLLKIGQTPCHGVKCLSSSRHVTTKGRNPNNGLGRAQRTGVSTRAPASGPTNKMERNLDCRRIRPLASLLFAVLLVAAALVYAHTPGAITGKVVDRNGNAMANVTVTAAEAVTGVEKHATTDASGSYRIEPLSPARYIVRAEAENCGCIIVPAVVVDDGQRVQQDFRFTGAAAPAGCESVPSKKAGKKTSKP